MRAGVNLPAFRLENTEPTGATWQVTSASDGQFRLTEVGAAARLIVDKGTGNVGIGVGAPTSKLHVAGNVAVTGTIASPTITSLVSDLAALTARVAKLESGEVVAADLPGRYKAINLGIGLNGNPARVETELFGLTFTLNPDGTVALEGFAGDCELLQGTTWSVACDDETFQGTATWSLQDGTLVILFEDGDQLDLLLGAGGRVAIDGGISEFTPGAGWTSIGMLIRLPNP
jgi:hypothetical protein